MIERVSSVASGTGADEETLKRARAAVRRVNLIVEESDGDTGNLLSEMEMLWMC